MLPPCRQDEHLINLVLFFLSHFNLFPSLNSNLCTKFKDSPLQSLPVCPGRDNEDHRKQQAAKIIQRQWKMYQKKVRFSDQEQGGHLPLTLTLVLASTVTCFQAPGTAAAFPSMISYRCLLFHLFQVLLLLLFP